MNVLETYGIAGRFINEARMYEDWKVARVIAQFRGLYKIITEDGECLAEVSGKFRHNANEWAKFPAVGDWVMVSGEEERGVIHQILSRKSVFLRTAVGVSGQAQVIAANIDILFICMSLNNNYNLSRLERYLSIAWDSGAVPVIVLTKTDLCEDLAAGIDEVERVSAFADIITISMYDNDVLEKFGKYLKEGVTAAFIGSSGVGKSTLINRLLGVDTIDTQEIGKADKGRHTTTGREMFLCPLGGVVIDTPGVRELGAENADLSKSFEDIEELAKKCRFRDCSHDKEPGCALQQALEDNTLDRRRFENYRKLKRESGYEGLNSREIEAKKLDRMFQEVGGQKNIRKFLKEVKKR